MSQYDMSDESDTSSSDVEVLNPEDLELNDNSRPIATQNDNSTTKILEVDESDDTELEEEDSDDDDLKSDICDPEFNAAIEETFTIKEYAEHHKGTPRSEWF